MLEGDNGQNVKHFSISMTKNNIKQKSLDKYIFQRKINIRK